ncbi:MAG: D-lyxose/D-mannose family sugar isomerase [Lentisphaerae bacterium GWF2_45_14]|nr:MAG: D-lyxose/D-mannose family sugar isomerase [Lentisphaerae bacterium GWF2_45_14]
MKRSEINEKIRAGLEFMDEMNFKLPPFARWSPEEWLTKGDEYDEIRDNMLGWDITDFGSGNFIKSGLLLFTLRNGNIGNGRYAKPYAEKIMVTEEEQITVLHFHWKKMEDIINRGGGNLLVQLYNSDESGNFANTPVELSIDGRNYTAQPGTIIRLTQGESITLSPGQYHQFWGEKGCGKVLLGEVSKVNDDHGDNRFYAPAGRFPEIEEDEFSRYLLCSEYTKI